ncbi:transcriptional regulator [Arthrobacter sp. W1]|nr:transcriptional regulator [Arthrobacter sp. W1]
MSAPAIELELSAPVNLRDLGGIRIAGGTLRRQLAIRTDDIAYATREVAQQLVGGGLAAVIDLRSPAEVATTGRGPLAEFPVAYHNLPLISDVSQSTPKGAEGFTHESMGRMYLQMVENSAAQLVTALNIIAYSPGATAFHCAAGRDRTGVLAAMLLLALGASDEDIVADYALTGQNMSAIMERNRPVMGAMWRTLGMDFSKVDTSQLLNGHMDVAMEMMLGELRARHGDPLAPLRAAGLSGDTIQRLSERAVQR